VTSKCRQVRPTELKIFSAIELFFSFGTLESWPSRQSTKRERKKNERHLFVRGVFLFFLEKKREDTSDKKVTTRCLSFFSFFFEKKGKTPSCQRWLSFFLFFWEKRKDTFFSRGIESSPFRSSSSSMSECSSTASFFFSRFYYLRLRVSVAAPPPLAIH